MGELDLFTPSHHLVNPYLVFGNLLEFIEFSELVFNAVVVKRIKEETEMYAELLIGDISIMIEQDHKNSQLISLSLWSMLEMSMLLIIKHRKQLQINSSTNI
jgi:uncharacterized glyoxalase superfamily protein PhnB